MKKQYLSAKKLSLWMRTVNKWKSLRASFSGSWSSTQWKKFNHLNSILGVKRKVALATLVGGMAFSAQAQDNYIEITDKSEQTFRIPILDVVHPSFTDLDDDGDLDLIVSNLNETGIRTFKNDDGTFNENFNTENPFDGIEIAKGAKSILRDLDGDGDLDLISGLTSGLIEFRENEEGSYVNKTGDNNPFNGIDVDENAYPDLIDLDEDGDLDLILGKQDGKIAYFLNDNNVFAEQLTTANPFESIDIGNESAPVLIDLDEDGDLDLVIGEYVGRFNYFENEGGVFTEISHNTSYFEFTDDIGFGASPTFVDINNDGNLDLVSSEYRGTLKLFISNDQAFDELTNNDNSFDGVHVSAGGGIATGYSSPHFADLDGDGDLDLISGGYDARKINFFGNENNTFNTVVDSLNPLSGFSFIGDYNSNFSTVDLDEDGDLDIVGAIYGKFYFYRNDNSSFTYESEIFDGIDVGNASNATFIDIDEDGDLDLISGNREGQILLYANESNVFTAQTGEDNPFDGIDAGSVSAPTFSDINLDGNLDLIVGNLEGNLLYFQKSEGIYTEQIDENNPFSHIDVGALSFPAFVDLDNDSDLDLVVGNSSGTFIQFENTRLEPTGLFSVHPTADSPIFYPNPASDLINTETGLIQISDIKGNTALSIESTGQIDISNLESGIYIVSQNGKRAKLIIE